MIIFFFLVLVEDLKLKNGMVIPAGAIIVVPVQLVQMDSSNWGTDALKFNPYRFLSRTDDRCISGQKESLTGNVFVLHLFLSACDL